MNRSSRKEKDTKALIIWEFDGGKPHYLTPGLPSPYVLLGGLVILLSIFILYFLIVPVGTASILPGARNERERIFLDNVRLIRSLYASQEEIFRMISPEGEFGCEVEREVALHCGMATLESTASFARAYDEEIKYLPHRWPLETSSIFVTSFYGLRASPGQAGVEFHMGLDLRALRKENVLSAGAGYVEEVRRSNTGYGNFIKIVHTGGYETRYAHLDSIDVIQGSNVEPGQVLGRAGASGKTTGPHLHYEVRQFGKSLDPLNFLYFHM